MGLLEREGKLAVLERLVERGGVVVVEGGAGIGKTPLLVAREFPLEQHAEEEFWSA